MKRLLGVFGTRTGVDVSMAVNAALLGAAIGRREWWVVLLYALLALAWMRLSAARERMWRDDTAELVEAVDTFLSGLEDFLGATTGAAAARLAASGDKLRAALARVKGGVRHGEP